MRLTNRFLYQTPRELAQVAYERASRPDQARQLGDTLHTMRARGEHRLSEIQGARPYIEAAIGTDRRALQEPDDTTCRQWLDNLAAAEERARQYLASISDYERRPTGAAAEHVTRREQWSTHEGRVHPDELAAG